LTYAPIRPDYAEAQRILARARARGFTFLFRPPTDSRAVRWRTLRALDWACDIISGYRAYSGVDLRDPTGDARLMAFCLAVPDEQYLYDGQPRALLKRTMADRLPAEVLRNPKRGLQASDWLPSLVAARGQVLEELAHLRQSPLASAALDLHRLDRLAEQIPATGAGDEAVHMGHRNTLNSGLMTGRFLRWVEAEGRVQA
jgi:asparagine synthase (glutamine-hydrolysing)